MLSGAEAMKILVVGDIGVGKTQLLNRFCKDLFLSRYKTTEGVDFVTKMYKSKQKSTLLNFWDLSGKERYDANMLRIDAKHAEAIIVCYDPSKESSFKAVDKWVEKLRELLPNAPIMLLSLQSDQTKREKVITQTQLAEKANAIGAILHFEVSAKESINVDEAFNAFAEKLTSAADLNLAKQNDTTTQLILRIHAAMHEAQRSKIHKKNDWKDKAATADPETLLLEVKAYADKKPHSLTGKAKKLHEKHPAWDDKTIVSNYEKDRKELIIEARDLLDDHNGLFKKEPRDDLSLKSLNEIEAIPVQKPHSCTAILVKGLRPSH